jgi:hypothetical protein
MSAGSTVLMDAAGRRRSPATIPGHLGGRAPPDADRGPLARRATDQRSARAYETYIDAVRGWLLIRHGKGDKRREAGMDEFGFEQLSTRLTLRASLPVGPFFCVIDGPTRGRRWSATAARQGQTSRASDRSGLSLAACRAWGGGERRAGS